MPRFFLAEFGSFPLYSITPHQATNQLVVHLSNSDKPLVFENAAALAMN
jgi:hypothetical protein